MTYDASSPDEYFRILDQLPFAGGLGPAQLARARRYAYHFFFNRMIPLPFIEPKAGYPDLPARSSNRLQQLLPGDHRAGYDLRRHPRPDAVRARQPERPRASRNWWLLKNSQLPTANFRTSIEGPRLLSLVSR